MLAAVKALEQATSVDAAQRLSVNAEINRVVTGQKQEQPARSELTRERHRRDQHVAQTPPAACSRRQRLPPGRRHGL